MLDLGVITSGRHRSIRSRCGCTKYWPMYDTSRATTSTTPARITPQIRASIVHIPRPPRFPAYLYLKTIIIRARARGIYGHCLAR